MNVFRFLLFIVLGIALQAQAEVYKCRQPDGRTEISNSPCAGGSSTVKAIQEEVIPEEVRQKAERDAEAQRQRADKLQAERRADDAAESAALAKQQQGAGSAPSPAMIDDCLRTLDRMALDSTRRAELEAGCRSYGAVQPVYVPVPYYSGDGYGNSYPPRPPRPPHVKPQPLPQPVNPSNPASPGAKPGDPYAAPGNYRRR